MKPIDLRSDTVTQPTPAMRNAMMAAPLGDDVFGDDPTVNALQERIAGELGVSAWVTLMNGLVALFVLNGWRLRGLLQALAGPVEQPAVVAAGDAARLDAAEGERRAAMGAALGDQARRAVAVPEEDQVLAQQAQRQRSAPRQPVQR